ncbi:hypothetical protein [Micromonospora costi]|uniref:Pyridoxamine 5'-phosphate oxidase family protein n=1 Tax=Micromonospora costi TaxID=1530042 RepID=A0A3B0AD83_9ACTN|nr:hypothetical protein [Micromonospora costi]RKN58522.1 hypothetical protein D7193_08315 [Micromonospora costi]
MTDEDRRGSTPLVDEVIKKAAVAWVSVAGGPARALWCATLDGTLLVVTGPGEQAAPGLADAAEAHVTMRGDHGGRVVTWPAAVSRVRPGSEEWDTVAPLLAGKRLNAHGPAADLMRRWADEGCAVNRLTPAGEPVSGDALPSGSLAEPPRDTPAARPTRRPFRLHRVRRR